MRETIASDLAPDVEAVELRHLGAVPATPDVAWRRRIAERAVARARELDVPGRHVAFADWMRGHAADPAICRTS